MVNPRTSGQNLANTSRIATVLATACFAVALIIGFMGVGGAFASAAKVAMAAMLFFSLCGVVLLVVGVRRHRAARLAGWVPAWERASRSSRENTATVDSTGVQPATSTAAQTAHSQHRDSTAPTPAIDAQAPNDDARIDGASAAGAQPSDAEAKPASKSVSTQTTASATPASPLPTNVASLPETEPDDSTAADLTRNDNDESDDGSPSRHNPATLKNYAQHVGSMPSESIPRRMARERMAIVERMLLRSEDAFATAKDVMSSGRTVDAFADLSTMLAASKALELEDPPHVKPIKLSRNDRYWLGGDAPEIPDEVFDAVLSLEAAFNICHDMIVSQGSHLGYSRKGNTFDRVVDVLTATSKVKPNYTSRCDALAVAYPNGISEQPLGEWELRMNIANAAENASLPFRIVFDMKTNAAEKLVLVQMQVPRPSCFSIAGTDEDLQEALARDYAYRSALFMAQVALGSPDPARSADTVVVTCYPRGNSNAVLSLKATRSDLPQLHKLTRHRAPIQDFSHPNLRMSWDNAWLDPVDPHLDADDPLFAPERYTMRVELSDRACSPTLAAATGARMESDLGVEEGASIRKAWAALECRLAAAGSTTEAAVTAVHELQETSTDSAVIDACSRVMRTLVDGTAEPSQIEQLEAVFTSGSELGSALATSAVAFANRNPLELERAADQLRDALTPSMQIAFMDDTESTYRHFHNPAERVIYNLHYADNRTVHLVPRAYYAANEMMTHLLCLLDRSQEAISYADEVVRLAPLSAGAAITRARVLEEQSKLFEAIDQMNECISLAPTIRDAALAYYRMAYLQWRTGSHQGAAACYRASISMRADIAAQAQVELSELLESDHELEDCSTEEAFGILRETGVNIWPRQERYADFARAAVICANEHLYPVAQQLSLALLEFHHDDALVNVRSSFSAQ